MNSIKQIIQETLSLHLNKNDDKCISCDKKIKIYRTFELNESKQNIIEDLGIGNMNDIEMADMIHIKPYEELLRKVREDWGAESDIYYNLALAFWEDDDKIDLPKIEKILYDYDLYDDYKHLIGKGISLNEKRGDSTLYIIEGILVSNTRQRNLEEILSDIRSVTGVTIVKTAGEKKVGTGIYQTNITIKIDPFPFIRKGKKFGDDDVKELSLEIRKIDGVRIFRPIGKPQIKKL